MKKTGSEIEADIFDIIRASALKNAISGSVYKEGLRPLNSDKEDAIVTFLTGLNDQIQTGFVNLNIYVKDIDNGGGQLLKNVARCRQIEVLANSVIEGVKSDYYRFSLGAIIKTFKADGINQHFVNCKIKFQLITF